MKENIQQDEQDSEIPLPDGGVTGALPYLRAGGVIGPGMPADDDQPGGGPGIEFHQCAGGVRGDATVPSLSSKTSGVRGAWERRKYLIMSEVP